MNLTNAGTWRAPVEELIPVGPLTVSVRIPDDVRGGTMRCLVGGRSTRFTGPAGWHRFEVPALVDPEVVVLD